MRAALSLFGIGYLPAPGTWGSIAALGVLLLLHAVLPGEVRLAGLLCAAALCCAVGVPCARRLGPPYDKSFIVLDEVLGMCIACVPVFLVPGDAAVQVGIVALVIFRVLDILKPFGIRSIDRWDTPVAVFLDDALAGAYAAAGTAAFWIALGA